MKAFLQPSRFLTFNLFATMLLTACGVGQHTKLESETMTADNTNLYVSGEKMESGGEKSLPPSSSGNCAAEGLCDVDYNNDHVVDMQDVEHLRGILLCKPGFFFVEGKAYDLNDSQGDGDPTIDLSLENPNSPCMDSDQGVTTFDLQQLAQFVLWTQGEASYPMFMTACQCFMYANYPEGHPCKDPTSYDALGLGTDAKPYLILRGEQLHDLAKHPDGFTKSYKQCADIQLEYSLPEYPYFKIGNGTTAFSGKYDGNGLTISDFTYDDQSPLYAGTGASSVGLFGTTSGAKLKNITLSNVLIDVAEGYAGGLVGKLTSSSEVMNAHVSGSITSSQRAGGAVGEMIDSIIQSTDSSCEVHVEILGGGLVGAAWMGVNSISDSHSTGNVSGQSSVGGFIGESTAKITGSYSTGGVVSKSKVAGGFVGWHAIGLISGSHATGKVQTDNAPNCWGVGGFSGLMSSSAVLSNSFATGDVASPCVKVGGLVGSLESSGEITNSYASGTVIGASKVGGLVGNAEGSSAFISKCYASNPSVHGDSFVGGLVGYANSATLSDSVMVASEVASVFYQSAGYVLGAGSATLSNNHYFEGTNCQAGGATCAIQGTPHADMGYFFDPTHAPMDQWGSAWNYSGNGLPTLP